MRSIVRKASCITAAMVFACALLAGCASGNSQQAQSAQAPSAEAASAQASPTDPQVRSEIEKALADVRAASYENVSFSMETNTSATGTDQGRIVRQTVRTTMKGELSLKKDDNAMHFFYDMRSSSQPTVVAYDMYVNKDNIFVKQNDKLYLVGEKDAKPENYISTITDIVSEKEVAKLLDAASEFKIDKGEETVITVTANASKLAESELIDSAALPAGASVATLVANYVIQLDNHLKTVRLMSSTSGTPTYRVNQTYNFSKYNETELPKWPTMQDQLAQDPRVTTDADGNMYLTADDGNKYRIESVDPDGTVHFYGNQQNMGNAGASDSGSGGYYYDGGGTSGGGGGGTSGGGGGGGSTSDYVYDTGGGGDTGMGDPQIADDSSTGMGEPVIYDDGE